MKQDLIVYVDFDSTLYNTKQFAFALWDIVHAKTGREPEAIEADIHSFMSTPPLGGYSFTDHMQSYGLDTNEMWAAYEQLARETNYLYEDSAPFIRSLHADGYRPHILSFGDERFQTLKIQPAIKHLVGDSSTELAFDVVSRKKRDHIAERHAGLRGVLIDDVPNQQLPEGFVEITLDRRAHHPAPVQTGTVYVVSDLPQAADVIRSL